MTGGELEQCEKSSLILRREIDLANKRRACPRGLYDGCPIPRELCTEAYQKTGVWHCLEFLHEFESLIFSVEDDEVGQVGDEERLDGEIVSLEELMEALGEMDGGI